MLLFWITFRSLTHAQRAARALERKGFTASIAKLPQELSGRGCAYAVIIRRNLREALQILSEGKIPYERVYERSSGGEFRETRP